MPTLQLLGTDHCELCDSALEWLLAAPLVRGLPLATVDITASSVLFERYAPRVPVLVLRQDNAILGELDWPFTERGLEQLLRQPDLAPGAGSDH